MRVRPLPAAEQAEAIPAAHKEELAFWKNCALKWVTQAAGQGRLLADLLVELPDLAGHALLADNAR